MARGRAGGVAGARARRGATPVLAPEIVLLYKAKRSRAIDEADFAACAPALQPDARAWLAGALAICAPEHPWRAELAEGTAGEDRA